MLESKTAKYGLLTRPILHAVTTVCLASVVLFGIYTLGMSLSQLIVFCGLLQLVYEPVKKFAEENANIQRGVVAAERMFEGLHLKPDIEDSEGAIELKSFNGKIEFENVWFRYQGEWILKDVSFTVRKGETVAIVGPTGAGKSTIVQLLPRLYEVQRGVIRIDGNRSATTRKSLCASKSHLCLKSPFFFAILLPRILPLGAIFLERRSRFQLKGRMLMNLFAACLKNTIPCLRKLDKIFPADSSSALPLLAPW